jgi:hypothetical protein
MSIERLVESLGERANREGFLRRIGVVSLGLTFGALGLSEPAHAYGCCNLCHTPSTCASCTCVWCWTCCITGPPQSEHRCCECYGSYPCFGDCFGAQRSCYQYLGEFCAGETP